MKQTNDSDRTFGGRARAARIAAGVTQKDLAEQLGISPSYLSLLEGGQREFPKHLRPRLAEALGLSPAALASPEVVRLVSELHEALAHPELRTVGVASREAGEVAVRHPTFARALVALHRALKGTEATARALTARLADESDWPAFERATIPSEEVSDFIQRNDNYFPELEQAAEKLWSDAGLRPGEVHGGLVSHLERRFGIGVRIVRADADPGAVRRFDSERNLISLSEHLPPRSRTFQLAHVLGLISQRNPFDQLTSDPLLTRDDSRALARIVLANYFAAAVLMPYGPFLESAKELRYDLELLGHRFGTSFEQIAHRLTSLRRPGALGVPFHFLRIDIAGNISKKFSGSGITFPRFSGLCARWNVHSAFLTPGLVRAGLSRMPDGQVFFCIARTIRRDVGGYYEVHSMHAIGLGCRAEFARELVYADGMDLANEAAAVPIGVTCRICDRTDCEQRATPPLNRPFHVDERVRGVNFYAPIPSDVGPDHGFLPPRPRHDER